jgi:NAD(P)-dependent dehydrogenase (short-subunit alcohol dehydrogenase family)
MTTSIDPGAQMFSEALGQLRPSAGRLAGRRILIVGAGQREIDDPQPPVGNGRAISMLFAHEGATLTCIDVNPDALARTCELVREAGGTAHAEVGDVADAAAIPALVERACTHMGGLDGLVLVVGVATGLPLDMQSAEAWDREYAVNVRACMLFSQQALKLMAPGGSIVLLSSIAALRNSSRNPAYETTKAAQVALARSVAMAGQGKGIRCNSLLPGLMDTPMGRAATKKRSDRLSMPLPFARQGTGWEVAHAALFLVSNESSYVNAHALVVDGGLTGGISRG